MTSPARSASPCRLSALSAAFAAALAFMLPGFSSAITEDDFQKDPGFSPRQPPKLPSEWSASVNVSQTFGVASKGVGHIYYDGPNARYRVVFGATGMPMMKGTTIMDTLSAHESVNMTWAGVCMADSLGVPFSFLFTWLPLASYAGQLQIDGDPCEVWRYMAFSVCMGPGGIPRHYSLVDSEGGGMSGMMNYNFTDVRVGPLSPGTFAETAECRDFPPKPCPDLFGPMDFDTYRIDDAGPWTHVLTSRNSGDSLGMANFMCTQDATSTKVLSVFQVHSHGSFGQYGMCNYMQGKNSCKGGVVDRVGRRGTNNAGVGAHGGQCSPNDDVGTQFSFPGEVECGVGVTLGTGGCMWKAELTRQVRLSCVLERGLLEQCSPDQVEARKQTFFKAIAAPEDGGCPSVGFVSRAVPESEIRSVHV